MACYTAEINTISGVEPEPDFRGNEALVPWEMSALVPEKMSDGALFPGSGKELFEISRYGKSEKAAFEKSC